jgi:acyl-CoA thioester hydrolase
VRRSSFRVEFDMRVGTRLVAEGYGVLVGFDYTEQKAAQLPEALRETLDAEAAAPSAAAS